MSTTTPYLGGEGSHPLRTHSSTLSDTSVVDEGNQLVYMLNPDLRHSRPKFSGW